MSDGDYVDAFGCWFVYNTIRKPVQHREAMRFVVSRKCLRIGQDPFQYALDLRLKPLGRASASLFVPSHRRDVFRLRLWVEQRFTHDFDPAPRS